MTRRLRTCVAVATMVMGLLNASLVGQTPSPTSMFRFSDDDFWLNLHHFLWVLGRAQNKTPDAGRVAVTGAPVESAARLSALSDPERATWADAVSVYAATLSQIGSILAPPMTAVAGPLSQVGETATLEGVNIDANVRGVLEGAAPVYRKAFWPAHRAGHQAYQKRALALLEQHGRTVHNYITRTYGLDWPAAGFPVHFVRFVSPQGNYSISTPTGAPMLVLETNENAGNAGLLPLEILFHEGMHQWDRDVLTALRSHADRLGVMLPIDLSHAMIFYTAAEAVKRIDPTFVPYADFADVWKFRLSGATVPAERLLKPLRDLWQPYLDGRGTRDEAMASLVAAAAAASR